ncbi:MAG: ABC transporter ATP-binding protein [Sneathiellales bacterium]|nr:ABC transporter ATP-binding protein [Sneathiellales bacterium]
MADIKLSDIQKSYGDIPVLKGVDLQIADGEFLTLVGPSGCGKSTLLRIIAGLEALDQGEVLIGGRSMNDVRASQRDLAMVFQSYALYPHLSVQQNMETPLRLRDMSFWERFPVLGHLFPSRRLKTVSIQEIVNETATTLKIDHLLERKPGQLSGGQRQRVALGRAMVRKPVAFLMDEPLSNLDAALRVHMRAELAELHRSLKTTFIYVTHDQAEALTMSDRMAVMMEGNVLQFGTPDDIYKDPRDKRVAAFVGSPKMNFLPGEIDVQGRVSAYGIPIHKSNHTEKGPIEIGVRPEHLEVGPVGRNANQWPFTVTHKENLGSDFFLHGHINGSDQRIVARATPEKAQQISIGAEIKVQANPAMTMAFAADNRRIELVEG